MPTTPTSLLMITPQLSSAIYMQMMMGARALLSPIYIQTLLLLLLLFWLLTQAQKASIQQSVVAIVSCLQSGQGYNLIPKAIGRYGQLFYGNSPSFFSGAFERKKKPTRSPGAISVGSPVLMSSLSLSFGIHLISRSNSSSLTTLFASSCSDILPVTNLEKEVGGSKKKI